MAQKEPFRRWLFGFLALDKPWFYLMILDYIIMWLLVLFGNPPLPFVFLSQFGWAWHHIPEMLSIVFAGMWISSWKIFSSAKIDLLDGVSVVLILIFAFLSAIAFSKVLWLVLLIQSLPFLVGYFIGRMQSLKHKKLEP